MMEGFSLNSHILGGIGLLAGVFAYGCGLARARKARSFNVLSKGSL